MTRYNYLNYSMMLNRTHLAAASLSLPLAKRLKVFIKVFVFGKLVPKLFGTLIAY